MAERFNDFVGDAEEQLHSACSNGDIEKVKRILRGFYVDANWQDYKHSTTPFSVACQKGHVEIVKLLLNDKRVDINKAQSDGATPFWIACRNGHIEIVKLLLNDKRIDARKENKYDRTPFHVACQNGHLEIVKLLLKDERVDINKANIPGQTPFWVSCYNGHVEIVKLLLSDKRVDTNDLTPFWITCVLGKIEDVKLLLRDENVDINKENEFGGTPLWIACKHGYIEVVKLLLNDKRVDINKRDEEHWTPFLIACENGHIEIAKLFINDKRISLKKKIIELGGVDETEWHDSLSLQIRTKKRNHSDLVNQIKELDTEQRYQEYLETFQSYPFFCIENEIINKKSFLVLNELLKKNKDIKELKFINCGLTPSILLEILKTLIWKLENFQLISIQNIEIDNIKLESTKGLEIIPIEIRNQGTKSIVQYILDLCKSPNSRPLYRTKLMVVGYENVGKTTLVDCLFPIKDLGETKGIFNFLNTEHLFELQGKYFRKYKPNESNKDFQEIVLEDKQWNIQKIEETGLELISLNDKNQMKIEIYLKDQQTRDKWIERLKRVTLNTATHGIEVNTHIWNSSTLNQLQNKNLEEKQNRNGTEKKAKDNEVDDSVEYSTWDFAGQHDYYNTHHYFLSNRSIFLVLYRMDQGMKGLESLDFWLKSLSFHLNQNYCDEKGKPFYSIIIVGTFLDSKLVINDLNLKENRKRRIEEIYKENGLKSPPFYFEVSCSTLENIDELREIIFNISLGHSYMGENVPVGYLTIEKSIYELRKLKQDHPIIEIQDLIYHVQSQYQFSFKFDIEFTKRVLKLLHEWGTCIYFDEPIELSNIVVLDPQYLTKNILGDLFKADKSIRQMRLSGIIEYSQLPNIWNGPMNLIDIYLSLLEKFEVCFILKDQQNENQTGNKSENQKKLIIPNLLLEDKTKTIKEKFEKIWPKAIPRGEIEIERIFSFNQVPSEMVSRLLVRFHDRVVDDIIWRRGVLLKHLDNTNVLCLLEVKMEENLFEIRIRGKERKECLERNACLEMMKYVYEEVKTVSGNYRGVRWKECVRSNHFSKGLIDLNDILEDCKLDLKDRKLICPITHFPIYGEDLLFKTGELDRLDDQNNIGNNYWNYSYENQNKDESETETIFENSQKLNQREYQKVEHLLNLFGFDLLKIDKIIGIENKEFKKSFEVRGKQIYGQHKDTPNLFKKEDWIEQSESELRKSMTQYLGDYISKFRKFGWNHGSNSFVIPMIQGTTEDAAWRICDNGFGTVCKVDAGYYSQGVYVTSKAEYAYKYCQEIPKVFVIGFVIVGNPFPVVEHPFMTNEERKVILQEDKPKKNENGYLGKPINPGYQSHFTLVDGRNISTAFPITNVGELKQKWIADELVIQESNQIYPSYIVYCK